MVSVPVSPCAEGHPELSLMKNVTALRDVETMLSCLRCGEILSFEEAVRNDERIRWAAEFERLASSDLLGLAAGLLRANKRQGAA